MEIKNNIPSVFPQDRWEHVSEDSSLEIFDHISLMTLDTIMKCAFNHQSSVQLDRSVTALPLRVLGIFN